MIYGQLKNFEQEKAALSPALQRGLLYLINTDLSSLPVGRHDIEGDTIFASVSEYETEPKEKRKPEAHQKYIDIQYVVSGEEMIGCSPLSPEYEVLQDELTLRDLIFYQGVQQEVELLLKPGIYAVLFPNDVHRPNCTLHSATKVKKVVLKIALSAL
ncbi:YhcH/YjgK/YiaL family protein [Pelosinus baikalensis]|uniref:YhcH/YjgK/YiaL family protein n=1 Tax=Pelosinus baikalensis TaxID=2892015 RepID=A0ABS8HKV9_9FIRM|nr:YhcH/YjgK/YiaL family protein [Pelosinus baikalensis]MCC5463813.1 YhcH/YjgK/YiaL family protein [Pelosinus baikalensis]